MGSLESVICSAAVSGNEAALRTQVFPSPGINSAQRWRSLTIAIAMPISRTGLPSTEPIAGNGTLTSTTYPGGPEGRFWMPTCTLLDKVQVVPTGAGMGTPD